MPSELQKYKQPIAQDFTEIELLTINADPSQRVQIMQALADLRKLERTEIQVITDRMESASIEEIKILSEISGEIKLQNQKEAESFHKLQFESSKQQHLQIKEDQETKFLSILRMLTVIIGVGFTTLGWYYGDESVKQVGLFVLGVGIFPLAPELVKAVLTKSKK
jgi:hypothetical protein